MESNSWIVVTGGPCSGKTTVLRYLEKSGYRVEYEIARLYIDEEMKKGHSLADIRRDEAIFQTKVLCRKIKFEKTLPKREMIFLERGMHDSLAYFSFIGAPIDGKLQKQIEKSTYRKIFVMEMLPYQKDYARTESARDASTLERLLIRSYENAKFAVIKVPPDSIEARAKYILERS
jgi:predicted ATPase